VQAVQALLTVLRTLYPERFGDLEPRLEDFSGALDSQAALSGLRAIAEQRLGALPAPAGFFRRWNRAGLAAPARLQHANGLAGVYVRRGKALIPSGCKARPATVAPAGSSRGDSWR